MLKSLMEPNHQQLMFVPLFKDVNLMEKTIVQIQVVKFILEYRTLVKMSLMKKKYLWNTTAAVSTTYVLLENVLMLH